MTRQVRQACPDSRADRRRDNVAPTTVAAAAASAATSSLILNFQFLRRFTI